MKYCRKARFSLVVQRTNLRYLGLVSLREVKGGSVGIGGNPQLCHVESFSWTASMIVRPPRAFVAGRNADRDKCREYFCQGLFLSETIPCIKVLYLKTSHLIIAGPQDRVHFRRQPRVQLSFPAHFDHCSAL